MNNGETIRMEMRRARSFLQYAKEDLDATHWARAVSSSYYATFHAAKAVLAWAAARAKTHGGVKRLFSEHAVKYSDFPPDVAATLGRLEQLRLTADYDAVEWEMFDKAQARDATDYAYLFVGEAEEWLQRRRQERGRQS